MIFIKNPYVLAVIAVYLLAILTLTVTGVYSLAEPVFMLIVFGLFLPAMAYFLGKRCSPLDVPTTSSTQQLMVASGLITFIMVYLVWGSAWVDSLIFEWFEETEQFKFFWVVFKKVVVFVLIPYWTFSRLFGLRWRDFGFVAQLGRAFDKPYLLLLAVFFLLYLAIQFFIGKAAQPVFQGEFPLKIVVMGGVLLYLIQIIEVGLVEEFFFRALLQTRLAIWLKSEWAGILLTALIFGLAHAPGLFLRGAGSVTQLGAAPDAVSAIAYSISVISLAGLVFGVIWAKTRNIYVLILIHAWVDTLAGLPGFIRTFLVN